MIYYQIQNHKGKLIAGNINQFPRRAEFEKNKDFAIHKNGKGIKGVEETDDDFIIWFVVEDEEDLLKSTKLFRKTLTIYKQAAKDFLKYEREKLTEQAHTLTTIQSQIRQRIEGFADDSQFYGTTFADSVANIEALVREDPKAVADLICYIHKRITDMRAHLLAVEVVHMDAQFEVNFIEVRLKRAILNQVHSFLKNFEDRKVELSFRFSDEETVSLDKSMFSLVMYNFLSNAAKYTKPNTEIRFKYSSDTRELDISMISLKMEWDELTEVSKEMIRGRHARSYPGNGIGLFAIQRALSLMGKDAMVIMPNYDKSFPEDGKTYMENHFIFKI